MTTISMPTGVRPTRRYEWATFEGVWNRQITLFKRYWMSSTTGSVVQPIIYLLAFGLGVGTLVATVDNISYVEFVGTGSVATAVLFASAFPGMFNTYVQRVFQKTYDALLAAPVSVDELTLAEGTWIATKAGVYGSFPLVVTFFFGLAPTWGMLLVPFIGFLTGLGFAFFGMWVSAIIKNIEQTSYITSIVLTPLFLVAGTFFPISNLPQGLQVAAQFNPLYHCVELVRAASFGWQMPNDLYHFGVLIVFAVLTWLLAVAQLRKKLVD
ncbi:MAG TPA: ABC transporter permease [Actinomycetes bacterium]|nr:ABC transporter permease [Actinomycetes bacterium]